MAAALLALTATAVQAAEEDDWLLAGKPVRSERGSLFRSLLTWPEEKSPTKNEGTENKDETNNEREEEPLESDRPDFSECSTTVGFRRLQIESGYAYTHAIAGDPTHNTHDLPELLMRYGVAERLELRLAWDEGMVFDRFMDHNSGRIVNESGSTDLEMGFKYAISKQDKWLPRTAIIVAISAPVGDATQSSRQVDAHLNFLYSWKFTKKLLLSCSTGNLVTAESEDHFSQLFQSATVTYDLTKKLHVFSEGFALFHCNSIDNRPQYYYDGGLTYLVTPNLQLDWRAGFGLNDVSDGFFTGCGLTIRL